VKTAPADSSDIKSSQIRVFLGCCAGVLVLFRESVLSLIRSSGCVLQSDAHARVCVCVCARAAGLCWDDWGYDFACNLFDLAGGALFIINAVVRAVRERACM
jgi:hypothetical protein